MNPRERPGVMEVEGGGLDMLTRAVKRLSRVLGRKRGRERWELGAAAGTLNTPRLARCSYAVHVQRPRALVSYHGH